MAKKSKKSTTTAKPSALIDTRVIYCSDNTSDAITEIQAFFQRTGKSIIALTVKDILEEQIAHKLA